MANISIRDLLKQRAARVTVVTKSNPTTGVTKVIEKIPIASKDKIMKFQNNLSYLLSNTLADIVNFFKARPKDIHYLGYDKELQNFAVSIDEKTWIKLTKKDLKYAGYVPVPERGTIWQARNSKAVFIVLDFINCKGILNDGEAPSIFYMDEAGGTHSCRIVDWQGKFIFCNHTVGKGQ